MNFDYKGQSEQELLNLVDEKKLNSGKCEWKYWTSEIYSFGKYMRKYGFFPSFLPLYVYNEHGVAISEDFEIPPHELENDAYCMFYMNPNKVSTYRQKSKKKCYPIKSLSVVGRHFLKIEKKKNARGTLFFFSHSTPSMDNKMNVENLCEQLLTLPNEYQPVCVCMHMHDINKGCHKYFFEKNIPVYTAGNTLDVNFCKRYYNLLKNFKYSASNGIGSYTFYSVEMGIPFFFFGNEPEYHNFADANISKGVYDINKKDFYREMVNLFTYNINDENSIIITSDQNKLTKQKLGLETGISRIEMSKILWEAYFTNENIIMAMKRFIVYILQIISKMTDTLKRFFQLKTYQNLESLIKSISSYYKNNLKYQESLQYFEENGFSCFPFYWTKKYEQIDFVVSREDDFPYVMHGERKLYFPKKLADDVVRQKYRQLLLEQDNKSSHAYFSEYFLLEDNSIFCDVGCAEAIISLHYIDHIKKLYLFECDVSWIEALEKTFEFCKEKVIIVNKYVTNRVSSNSTTLDEVLKDIDSNEKLFVKADIEGYERKLILGSKNTIKKMNNLKFSICTYHRIDDKKILTNMMKKDFIISYSDSYMIWPWLEYRSKKPYFVTGVLRAEKKEK